MSEQRDGWIRDPDGNWHPKPRPRITIGGWLAIVVVVAAFAAGGIYWNWKADQDRLDGEMRDLSCRISLDC